MKTLCAGGILAVALSLGISTSNSNPRVKVGIFADGATTFVVKAMTYDEPINNIFSNIVVTVMWPTTSGIAIGGPTSSFAISADAAGTSGPNSYIIYSATPNVGINWGVTSENELFRCSVTGGTSALTFSLTNSVSGGECYFEVGVFGEIQDGSDPFYASSTELALPVTLNRFAATALPEAKGVRLDWSTLSETNNYGFEVQKSQSTTSGFQTILNSFIPGHGTTLEPQQYSFTDITPSPGTWYYRLDQIDLDGTHHFSDAILPTGVTGVEEQMVPALFKLEQNYPNPFNPETQLRFTVEKTGQTVLTIYDGLGKEVATLFNAVAEPGRYYTVTFSAANRSSGIYFYRLTTDGKTDLKKMVLIK